MEHLEPCGPSLRPAGKLAGLLRPEGVLVELREEPLDLPRAEAKILGAQFEELLGKPEPGIEVRLGEQRDAAKTVSEGGL